MIELIYLVGVLIAYLLFNSITTNVFKKDLQDEPSRLLFHLTQIVVSFCSWPLLIMFALFVLTDKHLRRIWVFPLHFKINPKVY